MLYVNYNSIKLEKLYITLSPILPNLRLVLRLI